MLSGCLKKRYFFYIFFLIKIFHEANLFNVDVIASALPWMIVTEIYFKTIKYKIKILKTITAF